jgi:hypothetical protein
MMDEHTPTLQQIAADRGLVVGRCREHYRKLANWLRGIAAKCRLPYTQKELLDLARRYDTRADHIGRRPVAR